MNQGVKELAQRLKLDPFFRDWVEELKKSRPVVPSYQPGDLQETQELLERIKFESGRREGFDLLLLYITGEKQ